MNNSVYQMVADKIVEQLQQGIVAWQRPWTGVKDGGAINYVSRRPYSFLNQCLLLKPGEWLTFKQIEGLGGKIRKGEKASFVVFFKQQPIEEEQEDGEKKIRRIPILRYYNVWHIDQTEGIETKLTEEEKQAEPERLAEPEKVMAEYVEREGIKMYCDRASNRAFYSPASDTITIPMIEQYPEVAEYYSTAFHEMTHSTGAAKRLNRKGITTWESKGSETYSREELVAEMGAAMLCNVTGIDCSKAFKNSVAYIQGWGSHIKNDPKMYVIAASQAEKAARYIMGETIENVN